MLHNGHLASPRQEINTTIVEKLRKTRSELAESRDGSLSHLWYGLKC